MISLTYLLGVTLSWLAFWALYQWMLRQEKFLRANRFYLLGSLLLGLLLPLINLPDAALPKMAGDLVIQLPALSITAYADEAPGTVNSLRLPPWLILFGLGTLAAAYRFLRQLVFLWQVWQKGSPERHTGYWLVRSAGVESPFSFFHLLFWNPDTALDSPSGRTMLRHEQAHIRQKHSLDILLLELIGLLFWWNPLWHLYGRSIREVHEYLADEEAVKAANAKAYGHLLIEQCLKGPNLTLAHGWNHSSLKNRIHMLMQQKSPDFKLWKYSLAIPLLALLILACDQAKDLENQPEQYKGDALDESVVVGYPANSEASDKDDAAYAVDPAIYGTDSEPKEVFKVVEQMPVYGDCGDLSGKELSDCSNKNIITYVYQNVQYPESARAEKVEGMSVVRLVVSREGAIEDVQVVRPLHPAIDQEVYDLIRNMPNEWQPGLQRGQPVNVELVLPVRFKLE